MTLHIMAPPDEGLIEPGDHICSREQPWDDIDDEACVYHPLTVRVGDGFCCLVCGESVDMPEFAQ